MSKSSQTNAEDQGKMTFFDHLEELRWHIIRALAGMAFFVAIAFVFGNFLFDQVVFGPIKLDFPTYKVLCLLSEKIHIGGALCMQTITYKIQNLEMAGQFMAHLKMALSFGLVCAFPYFVYEIWSFIAPALYENERNLGKYAILVSSMLFFVGVLFGYYVLTPFSINFFANYSISTVVQNEFSLTNYMNFLTMFILLSGIMFELPMASYLLSKIGLLTPEFMREHRKHAVIVILIVSAIITPADIGTQVLVALPVYVLYEISILVSAQVVKNFDEI